jgi:hypothetical protein
MRGRTESSALSPQLPPGLLPLAPLHAISRPLSLPEYYHASVGASPKTLERPREGIFVLCGEGRLPIERWQAALDLAAAANPGARLRMVGARHRACWRSDGQPPRLRALEHCGWDIQSQAGADFIWSTPLPLATGPTIELIVAPLQEGRTLLILRALHAVVDGAGMLHFLRELFRALRGEPLLGSNAHFSDVELMCSLDVHHSTSRHVKTMWLTGTPQGDERGDEFRRITLGAGGKNLLPRVAAAMAEFAHRHDEERPAVIAVPVDLRRHVPGILATTNFANMLLVPLHKGEGAEVFRERLHAMLAARMDAFYLPTLDLFRHLPLPWMDRLLSRTQSNYRKRKPLETAVISNVGRHDAVTFSCPGFTLEEMMVLPLPGTAFSTLCGVGDRVEMLVNLPRVLAGQGRFDALIAHLRQRLG